MKAILFFTSALVLSAQIEGPRLGFLVEGSLVQTAWGVPGVAVSTVLRDVPSRMIAASPKQDYLLAVPSDGVGILVLAPDGRGQSDRLILPGVTGVDAILFSPIGNSVALRHGSKVDVITGLPARADIAQTFDLSFAGAEPARIAVSDDGTAILAIYSSEAFLLDPSGMSRLAIDGVLAAAFLPRSRDLAVASPEKMTVLRYGQHPAEYAIAGSTAKSVFATARFAVSYDGNFNILNFSTGQMTRLTPDAEPRNLQAAGEEVFYLTDNGWSALDLSDQPRLLRIPKRFTPETGTAVAQ